MTTAQPHPRIEAVIEETLAVFNEEVKAGRITSDAAVEKVQHLINTVRKYATGPERRSSDREAAPSSASVVDVVNLIELPSAVATSFPDVLTVDSAPPVGFVRLSFGLVNLLQVALLDVKAKQLYLVGGITRNLDRDDVLKLVHWANLYKLR